MPYNAKHILLRINGHFGGQATFADNWSCGLRLMPTNQSDAPTAGLQAFLTAIAPAVSTFHGSGSVHAGSSTFLDFLTAARIGSDGKYDPATQLTVTHNYASPVSGTGTPVAGWAVSDLISLRTGIPRGYASNGRFYYPTQAQPAQASTGRVNSGEVDLYVLAAQVLFNAINSAAAALSPACKIHVMSTVGAGTSAPVTAVRCDGRLDQQERRENKAPSVWTQYAIT